MLLNDDIKLKCAILIVLEVSMKCEKERKYIIKKSLSSALQLVLFGILFKYFVINNLIIRYYCVDLLVTFASAFKVLF